MLDVSDACHCVPCFCASPTTHLKPFYFYLFPLYFSMLKSKYVKLELLYCIQIKLCRLPAHPELCLKIRLSQLECAVLCEPLWVLPIYIYLINYSVLTVVLEYVTVAFIKPPGSLALHFIIKKQYYTGYIKEDNTNSTFRYLCMSVFMHIL